MKLRRIIVLSLLLVSIGLLISCDGEVKLKLFTQDLQIITESDEVIYTNASMIVEGMTQDYDYHFLETLIPSFSNPHYVEYNYSTSLMFDIKVPIMNEKVLTGYDFSKDLFCIVGYKTDKGYSFDLKVNFEVIAKINEYTKSTLYQSFNIQDFDFTYELNNDYNKTKKFRLFSSYIQENPYPLYYDFSLERRESLQITLSEILAKTLKNDDYHFFVTMFDDKD